MGNSPGKNLFEARKFGDLGVHKDKSMKITDPYYYPWSFYVVYVQRMSSNPNISNFCLGIFDFNIEPVDKGSALEATFDHSKYDNGVLTATVQPPGKVTLAAAKAGKAEELEIVGPAVSMKETNGMTNVRIE